MIEVIQHPIIEHNLSILKNKNSSYAHLRKAIKTISTFLAIHTFSNLKLSLNNSEISSENDKTYKISESPILVPIPFSSYLMLDSFLELYPNSKIANISFINELNTAKNEIQFLLPEISKNELVVIFDYAIISGNLISNALAYFELEGIENISIATIFSTTAGIEKIRTEHPLTKIYTTALVTDNDITNTKLIFPDIALK